MGAKKATFWAAVAGVALLAPVGLNLVADSKIGAVFPAVRTLNDYTTRRNG